MRWKAESYRSIRSVDLFSDSVIEKLESLHIETIEDLVALTQIESGPELLSAGLGYEPESFGSLMGLARGMCDTSQGGLLGSLGKEHLDEMAFACLQPTQAMMQDLGFSQEVSAVADFMVTALEAGEANHIPALFPIRAQGKRGTCVSFGTVALREFLDGKRHRLSEQYLYHGAKMRDGQPDKAGTWIRYAIACLEEEGVCQAEEWPYNPLPGKTEHQGPPPESAIRGASRFRISHAVAINPKSVNDLRAVLAGQRGGKGRVISFAIPVFRSWHQNPLTYKTGRIVMPLPGEQPQGGHCMCLVGYRDDPEWPGGGFFILRNSWGEKWGADCPFGAGYGMVPYKFIALYCWEAWTAQAGPQALREEGTRKVPRTDGRDARRLASEAAERSEKVSSRVRGTRKRWRGLMKGIILLACLALLGLGFLKVPKEHYMPIIEKASIALLSGNQGVYQHYLDAGRRAMEGERYPAALKAYSMAVAINPGSVEGRCQKALAHCALNDYPGAVKSLEEALSVEPNNAGLHYQRGLVLLQQGQTKEAVEAWDRSLRIDPNFSSARNLVDRYWE